MRWNSLAGTGSEVEGVFCWDTDNLRVYVSTPHKQPNPPTETTEPSARGRACHATLPCVEAAYPLVFVTAGAAGAAGGAGAGVTPGGGGFFIIAPVIGMKNTPTSLRECTLPASSLV